MEKRTVSGALGGPVGTVLAMLMRSTVGAGGDLLDLELRSLGRHVFLVGGVGGVVLGWRRRGL
jgi:hypothetical protein